MTQSTINEVLKTLEAMTEQSEKDEARRAAARERARKWREAHPERAKEYARRWREKHPDSGPSPEYQRRWRESHPGKMREYQMKYWRKKADQLQAAAADPAEPETKKEGSAS